MDRRVQNNQTLLWRIIAPPVSDATSTSVVSAYERRIEALEKDKLLLEEKLGAQPIPKGAYDRILELAMEFLANPCNLWNSKRFEHKRTVLKLAFTERLAYCRNQGYRTPKTTLPFKVLEGFRSPDLQMVPQERLELPT